MNSTFSIRDVCERYGVSEHSVLSWIRNGELTALNVGRTPAGKKPRWRITEQALIEFEALRTPTPPLPRTKRRKRPADVIEFYK
jgi:excisionase family DNA binding protein